MTVPEPTNECPHVVGHRGFSAKYPENTLLSFDQAVKAGANGIESDIHMTKDGEMVMLHDPKLDRTTDGTGIIKEQNWFGYIENLRTKKEPHCAIPRMVDVLSYLKQKENVESGLYLVLDIKNDNSPSVLEELHKLVQAHQPHDFSKQIVIGIWHPRFIPLAQKLFPDYSLCFIGVSVPGARKHFFEHVDVLSLHFAALTDIDGQKLIRDAHEANKKVYVWTVNTPAMIEECVRWKVDGVLGDDVNVLLHNVHAVASDEKALTVPAAPYMTYGRSWYWYFIRKLMVLASWKFLGV
ncbi:unnamed protein product [Umbelopsis ramanniana]